MTEIYQKLTQTYFHHIKNVIVYFDDILGAGDTKEELDKIVKDVLEVARRNNIKFKPEKVQYFVSPVTFLGFEFNKGQTPDLEMIESIRNLQAQRDKKTLLSIGLL